MQIEEYTYEILPQVDQTFMERYHFEKKDYDRIVSVGRFLAECVQVKAAIAYDENCVYCAVTLGKLYDRIEDVVEDSDNLFLAYGIECLAMEMLTTAYGRMNRAVHERTGRWMGPYRFPDVLQEEKDTAYLQVMQHLGIKVRSGMMHPLKSVVFSAEYRLQEEEGCHDCVHCANVTCPFRYSVQQSNKKWTDGDTSERKAAVYSYGISHILGIQS